MSKKKKQSERYKEIRNSKVFHDYFVEDKIEAGIVLTGTEVKSIRESGAQITDSFVRFRNGRPIMYNAHIAEYKFGNFANHDPHRPRNLLLHKKEIIKLEHEIQSKGLTLIPLRMYFEKALVKVELGLCRGKKLYDKRETLKRKEHMRETQRAIRHSY